jgi:hypothetical protein
VLEAAFIGLGRGGGEGRRSVWELDQRPLMASFRAGKEMGSRGDEGGGFSRERRR